VELVKGLRRMVHNINSVANRSETGGILVLYKIAIFLLSSHSAAVSTTALRSKMPAT
jgi:hypothetical protein